MLELVAEGKRFHSDSSPPGYQGRGLSSQTVAQWSRRLLACLMGEDLFRTENEFVQWLQALAAPAHGHERARSLRLEKGVKLGIGDDAALVAVKSGHELILTTDMSIEDVHFTRRLHPPEAVGHRALARSLSDVAAMGGVPRYVLVSLAISKEVTRDWVSGFYRGMLALARRFGVDW